MNVALFAPTTPLHDLGAVNRGERSEFVFQLRNDVDSAIDLGPVQTSYECIEVLFDAKRIEAGQTLSDKLVLDFRKDPTFTGGLLLTAEANTVVPQLSHTQGTANAKNRLPDTLPVSRVPGSRPVER